MSRNYLPIFVAFFFYIIGYSQNQQEYLGALKLNDTILITYRLSLEENKGNVKGYSISDLGGKYETRSSVIGEYDALKKELNFRETQTIYTKTPLEPNYDMCYVNTTLKNFSWEKTKTASSNFIGLFSDNTQCINGEIILNAVSKIEKRIEKISKKITKSNKIPDSLKQQLNLQKMMDSLQLNVLKKNDVTSFFTKGNEIKFTIYDGGKVDGDKVTILSNGKSILSNYEANATRKIFTVKLTSLKTTIVIKALNEGKISPNTVVIEMEDGDHQLKAISNLKKGESTQIDILKS